MVDRALAAPVRAVVFALSIIFLKKLLFFAFGAPSPPNTPTDSAWSEDHVVAGVTAAESPNQFGGALATGCNLESWL